MKKFKSILLIATAIVVGFSSCEQSKDEEPVAPSRATLLQGTWKVTAATVDPPINFLGVIISDWYNSPFFADCEKDNLFTFKSDMTYEFNEGSTKCNDSLPFIIEVGTWEWNTDETILFTTPTGGVKEETMFSSFSASAAVMSFTEYDSSSATTYTFTQTLTKQ